MKSATRYAFLVALFFAAFAVGLYAGNCFRWNESPSLPQGLYVSDKAGNLVEFCPPEPFGSFSMRRGFRTPGSCADGGAALLKPIVASRIGDVVECSQDGIRVNGKLLPNTAPRAFDREGRPLAHWPFETHLVGPGEVWVASSYYASSFDSRYFGPISTASIRARMRPVWVGK